MKESPDIAIATRAVEAASASLFSREVALVSSLVCILGTSTQVQAQDLETYDGSRGFTLRTAAVEVFVATEPMFRLLAIREPGKPSLVGDSTVTQQGLRLAFMGPDQIPPSFDVGNRPAEVLERTESSAKVRVGEADGLQYTVSVSLETAEPRLNLTYELQNLGQTQREIGIWSVLAFAREGLVVAPFGKTNTARKQLVLPWWSKWPHPTMKFGRLALSSPVAENGVYKVGVITELGWIAFVKGSSALVSQVPFEHGAKYAEDGANVTFFESGGDKGWREIEQVGPLHQVEPGKSISLNETLSLVTLPQADLEEPDALRKAIEEQMAK